jgi:alpha-N-acetylglucosamine transferase
MASEKRRWPLIVNILLFAVATLIVTQLFNTFRNHGPKRAYVSLLTSTAVGPGSPPEKDKQDNYFIAARLLTYQLLHAPATQTNTSIPFVLLVTDDVPERQRQRLRLDGATVVPIESVRYGLHWIDPLYPRHKNVMSKLRAFSVLEEKYDRILFLDLDTIISQRLDGVFDDAAATTTSLTDRERAAGNENALPDEYVYAGVHDRYSPDSWLNSGFFVAKPNEAIMNHYISLMDSRTGKLDGAGPDQDMLNYAHRMDGPMPWSKLDPKWNINSPRLEEWEGGKYHSIHEKWWNPTNAKAFDRPLSDLRWEMEEFFKERDKKLGLKLE